MLAGPGETRATMHTFDTHDLYDMAIVVVAVAPEAGWELPADVASAASAPPRLVGTTKDATATLVDADDLVPLLLGWTRDDMVGMLSARGATTRARMRGPRLNCDEDRSTDADAIARSVTPPAR